MPANNTDDLRVIPERVKLGSVQRVVHRDCWITILHHAELNIDLIIGAGTKEACVRAFELISTVSCIDNLVYAATVVATNDGAQPFQSLSPPQKAIFCTCIVGISHSSEFCELHGGRRRV